MITLLTEELFVGFTENWGSSPHKHEKCRICLVDRFGIHHRKGRRLRMVGGTSTPQRALNCLTHKEHKKT